MLHCGVLVKIKLNFLKTKVEIYFCNNQWEAGRAGGEQLAKSDDWTGFTRWTRCRFELWRYLNGCLSRKSVYQRDDLTEREVYLENGDVSQCQYGEAEGLKWITHSMDGEFVSHKEMHEDGRISHMKWASGKEQFWTYDGELKQKLTIYEDGRRFFINREPGDLGFPEVTSTELVSSFVDALTKDRK